MIIRILRRVLSAEAIGLILVVVALQALPYGISASLRNTDTASFFWVCLLAALIAFGLNKLNLNGIQTSLGMIALGILGVWILGARLASPLLDLGDAILSVTPQIIPAIRSDIPIDTTAISDAWLVVSEASNALSARVQTWMVGFHRNVTVNDALVRNMVWVLILWLISAWMGWFAARRHAIAALLPSIILLALIASYSEYRIETLWLMVFLLLLLMGIWNYKNHTTQWERRRVDYSDSIRYDVTQAVILVSLVIGVVAFITPSISWREIRDYLRGRAKNEIAETLGVQQQQVPAQSAPGLKPTLPREHLLSGGYAQSQQIVMTVRTSELPPVANPSLTTQAPRYYWRSTTYDIYVGEGWVTSSAPGQRYEANTPLIPGLLNGYRTLHLDVELVEPEGKLFWSGILFSADVPIRADWRSRPQSSLFADQAALLQADMFAAVSSATAYQAEAYIPLVTVEELRAASTEYPELIQTRYLRLPESVPERVRQLAREITKDKTIPYDKAKAIEAYLRTYPYDLEVPAPPKDQDVADFFLFDLKKGYCDYYATAMVVLARASGLPARFVSGYASGSYDAANAEYIVRELHAHSWAEVYFPEIGWIEFEPTAAQPEIEMPPSEEEIVNLQPDESTTRLLNRFRIEMLLYWLSPFAIILLSLLLYFTWIERWLYMRLAPATAVEKMYHQLYRLGRPLAGERTQAET
ncbi:MAG TPA: transglutaminase domain-containing protein, partial [Anaerolineales bacterium]|nr:transglutaminase domain-containing protein [Anaerolineales bacterium]